MKSPGNVWNPATDGEVWLASAHESNDRHTSYVDETGGAYYATRLGVLEYLSEIDRQAKAVVLRRCRTSTERQSAPGRSVKVSGMPSGRTWRGRRTSMRSPRFWTSFRLIDRPSAANPSFFPDSNHPCTTSPTLDTLDPERNGLVQRANPWESNVILESTSVSSDPCVGYGHLSASEGAVFRRKAGGVGQHPRTNSADEQRR